MCASLESVNQERDIARAKKLQMSENEADRALGDNILQTVALTNEFRKMNSKIEQNQTTLTKQMEDNRRDLEKKLYDNQQVVTKKLEDLNDTIREERAERHGAMKVAKLLQWLLTGGGIAAMVKILQMWN